MALSGRARDCEGLDVTMKMQGGRLVAEVMRSPVRTIDIRATLREAACALHEVDVGTLVIMDGTDIAGILSERDVVRALAGGVDPDETRVGDTMSESPRYVTEGDEVRSAVEVMLTAGIRHLPVVDEGELVGIVSMRDLIAALVH